MSDMAEWSSDIAKKTVEDAKRIAEQVVKFEVRKLLGKVYILWSTYPVTNAVLFSILSEFYPSLLKGNSFTLVSEALIVSVYMVLLYVIFMRSREITSKYYKLFPRGSKKGRSLPIAWGLIAAFLSLWFLGYYFSEDVLVFLGVAAYVLYGDYWYYQDFKLAGAKYYDLLAVASFTAGLTAVTLGYYFLIYVMSLIWVYAGYKSLTEVAENG